MIDDIGASPLLTQELSLTALGHEAKVVIEDNLRLYLLITDTDNEIKGLLGTINVPKEEINHCRFTNDGWILVSCVDNKSVLIDTSQIVNVGSTKLLLDQVVDGGILTKENIVSLKDDEVRAVVILFFISF